ncbi:hypothetical protein HGM15179_004393 [Zosterops borbonicus]|uniref:Uncharacterized protein n=1 Tax=Zosterops borbonicus TaxID=364589 RepID=A0A8K1LQ78_9PASS|nr:hypothetical protein HGM15179_004393 [Zosterops borbonicus]
MQPVPNPANSAPVPALGCQLCQECAVGDSVKGLAEVQIDNIHSPSCIHQAGHLVIKGDQVDQAGQALPKSMLAVSDPLAVLYVLRDDTQYKLFHNLAGHQGQADRPGVSQILLLPFLWMSTTSSSFSHLRPMQLARTDHLAVPSSP